MLQVSKFAVRIKENGKNKILLENVSFSIRAGEIVLLLGPNGAGKSSLANALMGYPEYKTSGEILIGKDHITNADMSKRAQTGLFLAHQNPPEIPGLKLIDFLSIAYQSTHPDSMIDIWSLYDELAKWTLELGLSKNFVDRNLNEGFSGGEKRKSEIIQMFLLKPKFAILDEIDSGVDIDSVKQIYKTLNNFVTDYKVGILIISHNPNILKYIKPNKVLLLKDRTIKRTGGIELATEIIKQGFTEEI